MATAMNGLDVLIFTGGVGENAPEIRARTATGLGFLGVRLDSSCNESAVLDAEITAEGASVRAFAIRAREDLQIAHDVRGLLTARDGAS